MTGGTLVISRYINLHTEIKKWFEELGFANVSITGEEKDSLNYVINELKPRLVIIGSGFYEAATPYMAGQLLRNFPELRIAAVSTFMYPDETAVWFMWYGVKSYINLLEGREEFFKGLQEIRQGKDYISPAVKLLLDNSEWQEPSLTVPKRQMEVLVLLCNGLEIKEIADYLQITTKTTEWHINELKHNFGVHTKGELMRTAYLLDVVTKNELCFFKKVKPASLPKWAVIKQSMAALR